MKDPRALAIEGKRQGRVPAVVEARARWSDGSIKWAWADFQGTVDDRYTLVFDQPAPAWMIHSDPRIVSPMIARQYDKLPAAEKGVDYFTRHVVSPGAASGSGRYSFPGSFLEDPKGQGVLCFGGDKGPILVSFPTGLEVLQNAPRPGR